MAEACRQKQYYDRKIGAVNLKPGDHILVKVDAFKGKRKIKDRWEEETWEVVHQIMTDISSYKVMNQHRRSHILHLKQLLLVTSEVGVPKDLPVKLPWGGKTGSYDFCHGHLLEHPQKTGEDLR